MSAAQRNRYDWTACGIAIVAGLGVAAPVGIILNRLYESPLLMTAVITTLGTLVGRWTYTRFAKPGARPLDPDG
jgi:hypothetical protein